MLKWSLILFGFSLMLHIAAFVWLFETPEATQPVAEYRAQLRQVQRPDDTEGVREILRQYAVPGDPSLVRVPSARQTAIYGVSLASLLLFAATSVLLMLYRLLRAILRRR